LMGIFRPTIIPWLRRLNGRCCAVRERGINMPGRSDSNVRGIPGIIEYSRDERIASWQNLGYGMFIHWGPYSVLGGEIDGEPVTAGYSEQIQMWADMSDADYLEAVRQLSDAKFDPDMICQVAKDAGMRYIV